MLTFIELLDEVDNLPSDEKLQLVQHILTSLDVQQSPQENTTEWHQFLRETYGSLRDTPIQRWEQGDYEEREPLG